MRRLDAVLCIPRATCSNARLANAFATRAGGVRPFAHQLTLPMRERGDRYQEDDVAGEDDRLAAALREPSLRAALLAIGVGLIWTALSRWRRSRTPDLW